MKEKKEAREDAEASAVVQDQTFQARLQEASFALGVSAEELSQMLPSGGLQELSGLEEAVRSGVQSEVLLQNLLAGQAHTSFDRRERMLLCRGGGLSRTQKKD